MAWNRRCGRTLECRVAVPVVTKRWRGHLSHSHPSGHLTPRQPPLAAPSPGYLVSRAWRLPILPISP